MLKFTKKEDIKAEEVESRYTLEYELEEKTLKALRESPLINLEDISNYIAQLPSIGAPILAEIIQKIIITLQ